MSAVQHVKVTPLILKAEAFEAETPANTSHSHDGHDHGAGAWAPEDGLERTLFTVLSNVIVGAAFGLVLAGAALLTGLPLTLSNGAIWGIIGFLVFTVAPTSGLPPELPGMPAADLMTRQVWWWTTVLATGAGIALLFTLRTVAMKAVGVALIAIPHLIGAPHPHDTASDVPAVLASAFASASIATAAVFWVVLGALLGYMLSRNITPEEASQ